MKLINRIKAALAAFNHGSFSPYYAVIYDVCEGDPDNGMVVSEEFYESFGSPEEAAQKFRAAFPARSVDPDGINYGNPRLVLIMGGIDDYLPG
jgi:hypothetical protein